MGVVYEGLDETLQRRVALKVIHSEFRLNADAKARFLREARILSQLDHPHICRVYDFIEGEEHDFLVLELVEGISLRKAIDRGLDDHRALEIAEQLLDVLVAVHGAGVVHRDLKPENVMLTADGAIKVLDFGLARSADEESAAFLGPTAVLAERPDSDDFDGEDTAALVVQPASGREIDREDGDRGSEFSKKGTVRTSHGMVLGTAGYMSPEQARGEPATAASDMYSLGLILQEIFTGRRAFDPEVPKELLMLRTVLGETGPVENVPTDLKTLIERLKSLDPAARPTALDAAERFTWIRNAPKRRRKRLLIATALTVVTAFAAVSTFQAVRLATARERERLANRFGGEVQRIDSLMRFAHLAPLHDIEEDRQRVRQRIAWIRRHLGDVGEWGVGPGLYAVGSGYLALGEFEEAREALQRAWDAGYREPEAAYALGRTLGALYQRGLDRLRFITDEARREEERTRIETELRDPAIGFLEACAGSETVQSDFVQGLLALHEGRFDDALAAATRCEEGAAWQYEGRLLEGRARFLRAREKVDRGESGEAVEDFDSAAHAFLAAAEIGESDPRCRTGLCLLWSSVMEMRLYGAGGDLEQAFDQAVAACDASLVADSRQPIVLNGKWACYRMLAESRMQRDPEGTAEALEGARKVAERLVEIEPTSAMAHQELGLTLVLSSILATRSGGDGVPDGRAGVTELQRAVAIDATSSGTHLDLGNAHQYLGAAVEARGEDPMPQYRAAAESFRKAIELRPDFVFAFNNLAALELMMANLEQERGGDSLSHAEKAIRNGERALEIKSDHVYALANIAGASVIKGRYLAAREDDGAQAAFDRARQAARKALDLNPEFLPGYLYIAEASLESARYLRDHGQSTGAVVREGLEAVDQALKRAPGFPDALDLRRDLQAIGR